jgi:hypothetical protein
MIGGSGRIGKSHFATSKSIKLLLCETPNAEPRSKGILRHVFLSGSTTQIDSGNRDSGFLEVLNSRLTDPRTPRPRSPMDFGSPHLSSRVISRATPPRSDGPRDFAKLHRGCKSSILFLLRSYREIAYRGFVMYESFVPETPISQSPTLRDLLTRVLHNGRYRSDREIAYRDFSG